MRQVNATIRVPAVLLACSVLFTACGGGGDADDGGITQSISFNYPGGRTLATAPAPLVATSTSGLPVSFTSNTPAFCTVEGDMLTLLAAGECSITATQEGGSGYAPATPTSQLFVILKHAQSIEFEVAPFQPLNAPPVELAATADSGLAVSYASDSPEVCTVNAGMVTLLSKGQCSITATQAGDDSYLPADPETALFTVGDAPPPVLTFLSGYMADTTIEGGAYGTYAGSNKDGWWCGDPAWCGREGSSYSPDVIADASNLTFSYRIQPNDPNHPNADDWIGGYFGVNVFAPGLTALSSTEHSTGLQLDNQTTMTFNLAVNEEWFSSANNKVNVDLTLGHFNVKADGGTCNVKIRAGVTPTATVATTYDVSLTEFTVSDSCELPDLTAASELKTYPISKIDFSADGTNTTNAAAAGSTPTDPSYPTVLTLTGGITFY